MKLFTTAAEITKAIDSIARRGAKLDDDIQLAGLSCLDQIEKHGDVTLFCRLFLAMPKGARRNALAEWGLAFGKLDVQPLKEKAKELPFAYRKEGSTDLAAATEKPWFKFRPEKDVSVEFGAAKLEAEFTKLLGRIESAVNAGQLDKGGLAGKLLALRSVETI